MCQRERSEMVIQDYVQLVEKYNYMGLIEENQTIDQTLMKPISFKQNKILVQMSKYSKFKI